jgi:hypothetical protein
VHTKLARYAGQNGVTPTSDPHVPDKRLLDDSVRTGVWPDSVQVIGGQLSMRLPTGCSGVAHYRSAARGHRDEAWLKKGLPCS